MTNKEIVLGFMEDVFNGWDTSKIENYIRPDYIQHNPNVENGIEGFRKFADFFLAMKPHMDVVSIAEDQNMVFVFFKCTLENGAINKVCDIYRLEDGMIAEHWDVVEHNVNDIKPVNGNSLF